MPPKEIPLLCHRCGVELHPGRGDFFLVKIEALADPTPPDLSDDLESGEISREIDRLIDQMRDMTERELMDQVFRRLTIHLCLPCYRKWIEDPAG